MINVISPQELPTGTKTVLTSKPLLLLMTIQRQNDSIMMAADVFLSQASISDLLHAEVISPPFTRVPSIELMSIFPTSTSKSAEPIHRKRLLIASVLPEYTWTVMCVKLAAQDPPAIEVQLARLVLPVCLVCPVIADQQVFKVIEVKRVVPVQMVSRVFHPHPHQLLDLEHQAKPVLPDFKARKVNKVLKDRMANEVLTVDVVKLVTLVIPVLKVIQAGRVSKANEVKTV